MPKPSSTPPAAPSPSRGQAFRAHLVHLYTASGVVMAFLAAAEICRPAPDPRWVFVWLALAVLIDATDGPLARWCQVKFRAPRFDGRTIDDIVDYLTFTFLPLLLVWRMGWLPELGGVFWVLPALVASLFGFANTAAKQDEAGFFLGFPSYWNIYAFYAGPLALYVGPYAAAGVLLILTILTLLPLRFIYPNRAPRPWRKPILVGAAFWLALLLALLPPYPAISPSLLALSALYPLFYLALSLALDQATRRG